MRPTLFAVLLLVCATQAHADFRRFNKNATSRNTVPLLSIPPAGSVCSGTATGTRGEAVTTTRATVRGCACSADGSSYAVLSADQTCVEPLPDGSGNGVSVWGSHSNLLARSSEFDQTPWLSQGTPTVEVDVATAPNGTLTADRITVDGPANATASVQQAVTGGTAGASYSPSVFIRRVSVSGKLTIANPGASANGQMQIDLALLGDGWKRVTTTHPAVTVINPFVYTSGGVGGVIFRTDVAGAVTFDVWGAQLNPGSVPAPYCPSGATAPVTCGPDQTTVATPAGLSTTEGCARVCITPSWTGANPSASTSYFLSAGGTAQLAFTNAGGSTLNVYYGTTVAVTANYVADVTKCYSVRWSAAQSLIRIANETDGLVSENASFTALGALGANIALGGNVTTGGQINAILSGIKFGKHFGDCR